MSKRTPKDHVVASALAKESARPGRRRLSDEVRRKGRKAKTQHGIFNRYIRTLQGPAARRLQKKIETIDDTLARGTRLKKAPVFEGGKRVGTVARELPLLPSERATLMAQRTRLSIDAQRSAPAELRAAFIEMLPEYAARNEFTREILLAVGVPEGDLDEAGIIEASE